MKVDVTAPMPGIKIPNLPSAGAMVMFGLLTKGEIITPGYLTAPAGKAAEHGHSTLY
jgi:hypothetical protein